MSRLIVAAFVFVVGVFFVTGCGSQPGRSTITYYRAKTPPPLATVERPGHYAVYPSDGTNPIWSGHLDRGDEYGFKTMDDGRTYAVAKGKTIPLQALLATNYVWKWQGSDEPGLNANGQPVRPNESSSSYDNQPQTASYTNSPSTQPMR